MVLDLILISHSVAAVRTVRSEFTSSINVEISQSSKVEHSRAAAETVVNGEMRNIYGEAEATGGNICNEQFLRKLCYWTQMPLFL